MPKNVFRNISEYTKIKDLTPKQLDNLYVDLYNYEKSTESGTSQQIMKLNNKKIKSIFNHLMSPHPHGWVLRSWSLCFP